MNKIIKGLLFLLVFWLIIYYLINYNKMEFKNDTTMMQFIGILSFKHLDKTDHNRPKIFINCKDTSITYDLTNDLSGLFEYIRVGDSIEKFAKSIKVRVHNVHRDTIFELKFQNFPK
jgi:hypothetical protein